MDKRASIFDSNLEDVVDFLIWKDNSEKLGRTYMCMINLVLCWALQLRSVKTLTVGLDMQQTLSARDKSKKA